MRKKTPLRVSLRVEKWSEYKKFRKKGIGFFKFESLKGKKIKKLR